MNISTQPTPGNYLSENAQSSYSLLQKKLLRISVFNFFLVALLGLVLRAYPVFPISFLSYKNVLHAHSHFAFGGWVIPILTFLILRFFPELCIETTFRHWRNSIVLMMISAYGMLLTFPFQGYAPASIVFSTLSIVAGGYAGITVHKTISRIPSSPARSFLLSGFIYFFVSAVGPFATGPLIAIGKSGTNIYYNAIYFYLHFQYNGFFSFIVMAVLYKLIERNKPVNHGKLIFKLLSLGCITTYFLSVLWAKPSIIFNILGAAGAMLQLVAIVLLLEDLKVTVWKKDRQVWLFRIAIFAFIAKAVLQLLSALPFIAELTYQNRNFIIAYLHLVLLGFISMFVFWALLKDGDMVYNRLFRIGIRYFLFAFITTELMLVTQAGGYLNIFPVYLYFRLIFLLSIFYPLGLLMIIMANQRKAASKQLTIIETY